MVKLSCSSVHACVHLSMHASVCASRNIVNTISCRVFDTFHQTYVNDALWVGKPSLGPRPPGARTPNPGILTPGVDG